jgi:hypothetical protein
LVYGHQFVVAICHGRGLPSPRRPNRCMPLRWGWHG